MVAAQRLGEEYTFRIDKASGTIDPALASGPEMARVRELMYWNMDNTARAPNGPTWSLVAPNPSRRSWRAMPSISTGGI